MYFPAARSRGLLESQSLLRCDFGQARGIELAQIWRIRFLPARGISRQHGDGDFGEGLLVPIAQPAGIKNTFDRSANWRNARGRELMPFCDIYDLATPSARAPGVMAAVSVEMIG